MTVLHGVRKYAVYDRIIDFITFNEIRLWLHARAGAGGQDRLCVLYVIIYVLYYYYYYLWLCSPARAMAFTRFLDHTQRRATVGRTPLGRVISSSQRPLPDNTQHTQTHKTEKHPCPGGGGLPYFARVVYFVSLELFWY
jgi:hypothetical protein